MISFAENWVGKLSGSIFSPSALRISSARNAGLTALTQTVGAEVLGAVPAVAAGAGNDVVGVHLRCYVLLRAVSKWVSTVATLL
jgi:hypothetical protein